MDGSAATADVGEPAGDFLRRDCRDVREALRADFVRDGVLRLASKTLVTALAGLSAQVAIISRAAAAVKLFLATVVCCCQTTAKLVSPSSLTCEALGRAQILRSASVLKTVRRALKAVEPLCRTALGPRRPQWAAPLGAAVSGRTSEEGESAVAAGAGRAAVDSDGDSLRRAGGGGPTMRAADSDEGSLLRQGRGGSPGRGGAWGRDTLGEGVRGDSDRCGNGERPQRHGGGSGRRGFNAVRPRKGGAERGTSPDGDSDEERLGMDRAGLQGRSRQWAARGDRRRQRRGGGGGGAQWRRDDGREDDDDASDHDARDWGKQPKQLGSRGRGLPPGAGRAGRHGGGGSDGDPDAFEGEQGAWGPGLPRGLLEGGGGRRGDDESGGGLGPTGLNFI